MRKILLLITFVSFSVSAQEKETIDLRWKITDTLTYKTIMHETVIEQKENEIKEKTDTTLGKMTDFLEKMQEQIKNKKFETKLYPDINGNIDIAMLIKKDETDTTDNLLATMAAMNGDVVLRGKVSPMGELLSFYYNTSQTNLISLLFELPTQPITVGEKWSLNVDMIAMDQNFVADSAYKKNIVKLEKIIDRNGDRIAVIKYDIEEFVSGNFGNELMTMFIGKNEDIFMKMTHQATAYFSTEKGIWIKYNGIMEIDTNFSLMGMGGKKRTIFKLTPK